jgi:hypothetical protein
MKPLNINEFLERYVIVNVCISTWSARRNNTPKDLGLEDETISKDVASVGGKSVFDLKKIKFMSDIRRETLAYLGVVGFQILGGWAIRRELHQEVMDKLELLRSTYYEKLDILLADYASECEAWIADAATKVSIPGFSESIRRSLYSEAYVRNQVRFTYSANLNMGDDPVGDTAAMTVAQLAEESLRDFQYSMSKGHSFSRKSMSYLTKVRDKLAALSLLDSFCQPAIDEIDKFEAQLNAGGKKKVDVTLMQGLMGQLSLLANPDYLISLRSANMEIENEPDEVEEPSDFLAGLLELTGSAPDTAVQPQAGTDFLDGLLAETAKAVEEESAFY